MTKLKHMVDHRFQRRRRDLPGERTPCGEDGMAALELAISCTVLIIVLLAIVAFGRITYSRQLVNNAAAAGARAAALTSSPASATPAARSAVSQTLTQSGLACQDTRVDVDTSQFVPGGQVSVRVRCTSDLSALALTGLPAHRVLQAVSRVPLEPYRVFSDSRPS